MIGFYKVKKLVGLLYQLELPTSIKIYNVFSPNLFWKVSTNLLPGQHNNPAPHVIINNKKEWEINDILNAKKKEKQVVGGKIQYRVK